MSFNRNENIFYRLTGKLNVTAHSLLYNKQCVETEMKIKEIWLISDKKERVLIEFIYLFPFQKEKKGVLIYKWFSGGGVQKEFKLPSGGLLMGGC